MSSCDAESSEYTRIRPPGVVDIAVASQAACTCRNVAPLSDHFRPPNVTVKAVSRSLLLSATFIRSELQPGLAHQARGCPIDGGTLISIGTSRLIMCVVNFIEEVGKRV